MPFGDPGGILRRESTVFREPRGAPPKSQGVQATDHEMCLRARDSRFWCTVSYIRSSCKLTGSWWSFGGFFVSRGDGKVVLGPLECGSYVIVRRS
jgi:hypothetical protein